jgi:2-amino-4-hydroxy-6-hydroxymethyldihydropteridine diphosphokinase
MIVYLGLGSNVGNLTDNLKKAISHLEEDKNIEVIKKSSYYKSSPVDTNEGGFFVNQVICIKTNYVPLELLEHLENIELGMGRKYKSLNKPRIIDIDILLYENKIIKTKKLRVPHDKMDKRLFVLNPLKEIFNDFIDPRTGKNIDEIISINKDILKTQQIEKLEGEL